MTSTVRLTECNYLFKLVQTRDRKVKFRLEKNILTIEVKALRALKP